MNSLPWPGPSLWASMVPPCSSTSRWTRVRPMPSPPCDRSSDRSTCVNRSKMRGSMLGGDADAGVPHPHDGLAAFPLGGEPDVAAPLGVLGGVVEQVREHLRQPGRVGVQGDRLGRQGDGEFVAACLDERAAGLDGHLQRPPPGRPLLAQVHLLRVMRETSSRSSISRTICCTCRSITSAAHCTSAVRVALAVARSGRRCGSGPAGCAARGPASPGTRPSAVGLGECLRALLEQVSQPRHLGQAVGFNGRVVTGLEKGVAERRQQVGIDAQGGPLDRLFQASQLPHLLIAEAESDGNMLQHHLFGILVEHLSRQQRPHGVLAQHQRHGDVYQPRAITVDADARSGEPVGDAAVRLGRHEAERTGVGAGGTLRAQQAPRRPGVNARAEQTPLGVDKRHGQLGGSGVPFQPRWPGAVYCSTRRS